jgi:type I restriction enzyme S subunit
MKKLSTAEQRFLKNATLIAALQLIFQALKNSGSSIYRIDEIAETTSGGTPNRTVSAYYGGEIPWIKSGELNDDLIEDSEEYITEEGLKNSSAKIYPKGTLVIALYGATVGKTGILGIEAASNQAVCAVIPKSAEMSKNFLFWFLRHKRQDFLRDSFGGAQPNISQKILRETLVPIPSLEIQNKVCLFLEIVEKRQRGYEHLELPSLPSPLDEQRRIVARIEELAAKVEEARGLRRQSVEYGLPSLRNGIFRKAFQGKFLDYSTNEFPKDELSSIGKWVRLGDICSLITDGTHQTPTYTEKGMMFLSAQNIKPYRFMPENYKYVSYEDYLAYTARNKVQKGDILITRVGAGIGEVAMVDQDIDFAIYVSLGHIRAIQDFVYTPYLVHWLNSPAGVAQSREKILGKGHSQGNLNLNLIRQFLVPLPPLSEQHRIVVYLDDLQAKVDALKRLQAETAAELDALLPSILDKAFKGEL